MRGLLRLVFWVLWLLLLCPAAGADAAADLTVPGPITVEAQDASGADVTYTATATNPAGHPVTVSCAPPVVTALGTVTATARFPLGVTTVTCTVTDEVGTVEATASFSVTVEDTTPPVIAGTTAISVQAAGGGGTIVSYVQPVAVDSVDGPVLVSCAPPPGSLFPIGTTTVTCTASDSHGNKASAAFTVVVTNPAPPPSPPPLPQPPAPVPGAPSARDTVPPHEVSKVRVESNRVIQLSWVPPGDPDFDHVEIDRFGVGDTGFTIVYRGSADSFTDHTVRAGNFYRYLIIAVDLAGNRSAGIAVAVTAKLQLLLAPRDGAITTRPPRLSWRRFPTATYYNLQLFRGTQKIFSAWPIRTHFRLRKTWTFAGKRYALTRGTYRWYVWPGLGPRNAIDYGPLLGERSFTIAR